MAVPTYDQLIEPLLRVLGAANEGLAARDARARVAEAVGLAPEDLEELLPSGQQPVFDNRAGWAHDRLKRAGLSASVRRGFWRLTPAGREFVSQLGVEPMSPDEVQNLAVVPPGSKVQNDDPLEQDELPKTQDVVQPDEVQKLAPTERIDAAVEELNSSLESELLETILQSTPAFFEQLVLDVLKGMGYGTSRTRIQSSGGSGDGGIDGIITLDRLGLEKVYVQAKRWQNTVGRPEIQGFFGALASRRATKGVFITTSRFTREATEFASQASDSLVLVDGALLTRLMVEYEVGVSVERTIKLCRLDSDYFEEG